MEGVWRVLHKGAGILPESQLATESFVRRNRVPRPLHSAVPQEMLSVREGTVILTQWLCPPQDLFLKQPIEINTERWHCNPNGLS